MLRGMGEGTVQRQQSTETLEKLYDGKLRLERRNGGSKIYARTYIQGKSIIKSTGVRTVKEATRIATDWYLELRDRVRKGEELHGVAFADVAEKFLAHADLVREVSEGQRRNYRQKWALLKSFFRVGPEGRQHEMKVTDVDSKFLLELREKRSKALAKNGKPIRPATLKKDLDFVRLVLRHAKSIEKVLDEVPQFPSFRGAAWEVIPNPRPFLDLDQWRKVRNLAKDRIREEGINPRTKAQRQELYWFMLFCVGGALRVGEAYSLRWRDCELIRLKDKDKTEAVHLRVLGKHSRGGAREDGYGLHGAVSSYKAMKAERRPGEEGGASLDDLLFTEQHREGIKELLKEAGLRETPDGRTRDAKSLRQTGISMRLEKGPNPDYRDIAKWCRSSAGVVAAFYDQCHPEHSVERITGFRARVGEEEK